MRDGELRKAFPLFLLLFLISLFLFLIDNFGWLARARGIIQRPFLVLERPIYLANQSVTNSIKQLTDRSQSERIIQLQTQLRQLAIDQNQLATCLEENEHLKKLLGAPLPSKWKFKMARVVGVAEKMRIDKGARDGVKEGMAVVSENIYVGKVISVGAVDSLVQLPTDLNSKIPVVVKKPASAEASTFGQRSRLRPTQSAGKPASSGIQARGLLKGQFGGNLLLDRVLQEEDIRQGDLVVTSGEEGYLPDLVIGQIEEVLRGTAEIYQQAVVSPLIDYQGLSLVFLVIP